MLYKGDLARILENDLLNIYLLHNNVYTDHIRLIFNLFDQSIVTPIA